MSDSAGDLLAVLVDRWPFVDALYGTEQSKRSLAEAVGVSRSTVRRAVRDLANAGVVARTDGEYRLTPFGRLVVEECRDLRSLCDSLAPVADAMDDVEITDIPRTMFLGADVYTPETHSPYRPAWRLKELTSDADSFVYVTDRNSEVYVEVFSDAVLEDDGCGALVVDPAVAESLVRDYPGVDEVGGPGADGFSLWVSEDLPGFGVGVVTDGDERRAVLVVHDDHGGVELLVVNDGLAVEWALGTFLRQYERAHSPSWDDRDPDECDDPLPDDVSRQVPAAIGRQFEQDSTDLALEDVIDRLPRTLDDEHLEALAARVLDEQDRAA